MKKIFIYSLSILLTSTTVYAQTCTPTPDCGTLGYTKTASECGESVKCPFDTSKVFCVKDLVEFCEVGSILYSDKSCSKTVVSGKKAIGVVFSKEDQLAVALTDLGSSLPWSPNGKYEDVTALSNCGNSATVLACNPNGKDNTSKIVAQYGSTTNYAAAYCADYATSGTSKGDWYLPSIGELSLLYNAKSFVNATLGLLGRSPLIESHYYWSSTENGNLHSWVLSMGNGNIYYDFKLSSYYVRAVVAF